MMEASTLHANLSQFCGCEVSTQHAMCRNMFMSEGVVYLREHAEAYWLLDAIASHYSANPKLRKARAENERFDYMHFWVLKKNAEGDCTLICREDSGMKPVVKQEIEYTDFPFPPDGEFMLYAGLTMIDGEERPTLVYLPSEH
jgi:hypothetical protein